MGNVILVDKNDSEIGQMEKLEAHQKGLLHRAFSILLMNSKGEMLIQKRALHKYHSGGLWSNACCSHPTGNDTPENEARKRLIEEMGIDTPLRFQYSFIYNVALDNNLIEHELDYVFLGTYDDDPIINKEEAMDWKFIGIKTLEEDMKKNPNNYSYWFRLIMEHWENKILQKN